MSKQKTILFPATTIRMGANTHTIEDQNTFVDLNSLPHKVAKNCLYEVRSAYKRALSAVNENSSRKRTNKSYRNKGKAYAKI